MIQPQNVYKVNLRDYQFLLWEQFKIDENLLRLSTYQNYSQDYINKKINSAKKFAYQLGAYYQLSDREGCQLIDEKTIQIPTAYLTLWPKYKIRWGGFLAKTSMPRITTRMIVEMFMGANPSFMTYGGFGPPSAKLIDRFGTEDQRKIFVNRLRSLQWTSCLCLTETQAGSDVSAIETYATKINDHEYLIKGEKIFISGGGHQLTENLIYLVVAKVNQSESNHGLSCFIVPKYQIDNNGKPGTFNHVTYKDLPKKMGFNGCVNSHLLFGHTGECRGYLLGSRENVGLQQVITLMNEARMMTGIIALGLASSAYLNSLHYANERKQGRRYTASFSSKSPRLPIIEHYDVYKMLLEMKSKVEGCRAIIAKAAFYESLVEHYKNNLNQSNKDLIHYYESLISIYNPIIKAYISDEAWRICELAIQVYGGNGYMSDFPLEQYARDVKVLSIWEGTNYIQSQILVREKLCVGRNSMVFNYYMAEAEKIINGCALIPDIEEENKIVTHSLEVLNTALNTFTGWVTTDNAMLVSGYSTLFLKIMAKCSIALLHLEAAAICNIKLTQKNLDVSNILFYKGKIASARFYIQNILPEINRYAAMIANQTISFGSKEIFMSDLEN
jgi:acyl-CoA dehydrogenase